MTPLELTQAAGGAQFKASSSVTYTDGKVVNLDCQGRTDLTQASEWSCAFDYTYLKDAKVTFLYRRIGPHLWQRTAGDPWILTDDDTGGTAPEERLKVLSYVTNVEPNGTKGSFSGSLDVFAMAEQRGISRSDAEAEFAKLGLSVGGKVAFDLDTTGRVARLVIIADSPLAKTTEFLYFTSFGPIKPVVAPAEFECALSSQPECS